MGKNIYKNGGIMLVKDDNFNMLAVRLIAVATAFLILAGCSKKKTLELDMQELKADTIWSGEVHIKGDIYVPPGVVLTITPGTVVKFDRYDATREDFDHSIKRNMFDIDSPYYPQAEIIIRGTLIARGTKDNKIVFTSAEVDARAADWGALNFLGSSGNIIEHVKIFCGYNGIHAHGSAIDIKHSEFARNGVGISFKAEEETPEVPWFGKRSQLTIVDCIFTRNKGGIGFRNSDAVIRHNEIVNNKFFGLWPKENCKAIIEYNEIADNKKGVFLYQAKGVELHHNNIYDSGSYNISVAEAQDFPFDATNNWFGTINKEKIDEMIFDKKDDESLAEIKIEPFLVGPVDWELK